MKVRALLFVCLFVTPAFANSIQYTINFNQLESFPANAPAPTGSFIYNHDAPAFRDFFITTPNWTYDLTDIVNSLSFCTNCANYLRGPVTCGNGQPGAAAMFDFINRNCLQEGPYGWASGLGINGTSFFHWYSDGSAGEIQLFLRGGIEIPLPASGAAGSTWTVTQVSVPESPSAWLLLVGITALWGYGQVRLRTSSRRSIPQGEMPPLIEPPCP